MSTVFFSLILPEWFLDFRASHTLLLSTALWSMLEWWSKRGYEGIFMELFSEPGKWKFDFNNKKPIRSNFSRWWLDTGYGYYIKLPPSTKEIKLLSSNSGLRALCWIVVQFGRPGELFHSKQEIFRIFWSGL